MVMLRPRSSMFTKSLLQVLLVLLVSQLSIEKPMEMEEAKEMLHKFGYLDTMTSVSNATMQEAITEFQQFSGIHPTGEMNGQTMEFLGRPRCGMPDFSHSMKSEDLIKGKWEKTELTYKILNYTNYNQKDVVNKAMERSAAKWTQVVNLTIRESHTDLADILFYFSPQDGSGRVLGYSYPPEIGEVYFDSTERWSFSSVFDFFSDQINFDWVATHELGHALGLPHTDDRAAVMYPYYRPCPPQLAETDKKLIKEYYGTPNMSELCTDPKIDAILFHQPNLLHLLIKGHKYWTFTVNLGVQTGPYELDNLFKDLPCDIDAAFSSPKDTYFLHGNNSYRYRRMGKSPRKKPLSIGFDRDMGSDFDATFYHPNGTLYLFKGSIFYALNMKKQPGNQRRMVHGALIRDYFPGIPGDLDAATILNFGKRALFLKGTKYYIFSFLTRKIDRRSPHDALKLLYHCE